MNAPLKPIWLCRPAGVAAPAGAAPEPADSQPAPALQVAEPSVQRHLWHSRYGTIMIEVRDGTVYVDGDPVRPAEP